MTSDAVQLCMKNDGRTLTRETLEAMRFMALERMAEGESPAAVPASSHIEKFDLAMKLAVDERDRLMRRTEMEMQKLQSRWEGNERHWLMQIEQLREDAKRARSDYEVQTKLLGKQLNSKENELITCKRDLVQERKQSGVIQKNLVTEREKRIAAESARKAILSTRSSRRAGKGQIRYVRAEISALTRNCAPNTA